MKKIELTQGQFAVVDDSDFANVSRYKWFYHSPGYAARQAPRQHGKQREIKMHRFILGVDNPEIDIDHKNGNGLDNRRENLRTCNAAQNRINAGINKNNSTGFKGVYLHKQTGRFVAYIGVFGKIKHLGIYKTLNLAALARRAAERKYYKDFSHS